MSLRRLLLLILAAALVAAILVPAAGAQKRHNPKKVVTVGDDYFAPAKLTGSKHVKVGTTLVWKWAADNSDTHDVKLTTGPKHVKRFHSRSATADYTYRQTLTKPGLYKVICTFHANDMRQSIRVVR